MILTMFSIEDTSQDSAVYECQFKKNLIVFSSSATKLSLIPLIKIMLGHEDC